MIFQQLVCAANDTNLVLMASSDLSAAFEFFDIELHLKRLRVISLPMDLIDLI
jgi:hypothetical protein